MSGHNTHIKKITSNKIIEDYDKEGNVVKKTTATSEQFLDEDGSGMLIGSISQVEGSKNRNNIKNERMHIKMIKRKITETTEKYNKDGDLIEKIIRVEDEEDDETRWGITHSKFCTPLPKGDVIWGNEQTSTIV